MVTIIVTIVGVVAVVEMVLIMSREGAIITEVVLIITVAMVMARIIATAVVTAAGLIIINEVAGSGALAQIIALVIKRAWVRDVNIYYS